MPSTVLYGGPVRGPVRGLLVINYKRQKCNESDVSAFQVALFII